MKLFIVLTLVLAVAYFCPQNCNDCGSQSQICTACADGFQLNIQGTCTPDSTVPNCILYDWSNKCISCQPTFKLSSGTCVKDYNGCLTFGANHNICTQCGFGTVLLYKTCAGALNCKKPGLQCSKCISGFAFNGFFCQDQTGNCNEVGDNGVCLECNDGYTLIGFECVPNDASSSNCYIYDASSTCYSCKAGYQLNQGQCMLPSQIVVCNVGYYYSSNGACLQVSVFCDTYSVQNGQCQTCKYNLTLTNGNCIDPNCANQILNGCVTCNSYFIKNSNNYCQYFDPNCISPTATRCNQCASGYFITAVGMCIQVKNCTSINPQTSLCIQCNTGYTVNQGACVQNPANCQNYNPLTKTCLACVPGYTLVSNNCVLLAIPTVTATPNCLVYSQGACRVCANRYYLSNGACTLVSILCSTYNTTNGNCLTCLSGYALQSGQCIYPALGVDPNCAWYTYSYCTKCAARFILINFWCYAIDPNCINFDYVNNICRACKAGKIPVGRNCR